MFIHSKPYFYTLFLYYNITTPSYLLCAKAIFIGKHKKQMKILAYKQIFSLLCTALSEHNI